MSATRYAFGIDPGGSLLRARAVLGALPEKISRAERRALRELSKWAQRQVLRAAAQEIGVSQKALKAAARFKSRLDTHGISIWIGTNPLKAHLLGTVRWTRRMLGAKAGRRQFPGAWSWGEGSKTGKAIMRRTGKFGFGGKWYREQIAIVTVPVHEAMARRLDGMGPEIAERFDTLFRQQLNYALHVEGRR